MDYTLVQSNTLADLVAQVKSLISQGWLPLGGVAINERLGLYQAMVKN